MFEPLPAMDGKRQATTRLIQYIETRCVKETFSALAREIGIDDKTVRFVFDDYVARRQKEVQFVIPEVLGIDELKIIGDYRAMLTNIDKLALFDLLPSRKKVSLLEYFNTMPDKQNVQTLVMDMWNPYRQIGKKVFPGKLIVADRFHVVRMANKGMERVRKQIRKTVDDRTRIKLKDERFLLLKRKANLDEEGIEKTQRWFAMFPQLGMAYDAKERFFDIYCQPTREAAEMAAVRWASSLDPMIEKQFRDLRVALYNWHEEIFNYYENPVTNAYTEAMNNITRFINRMGRGYSFEVLRARLLYDEKVIKGESTAIRKKVRKVKAAPDPHFFRRMIGSDNEYEDVLIKGPAVNYGADLLTLARFLEEGYFFDFPHSGGRESCHPNTLSTAHSEYPKIHNRIFYA
jgi:transposase